MPDLTITFAWFLGLLNKRPKGQKGIRRMLGIFKCYFTHRVQNNLQEISSRFRTKTWEDSRRGVNIKKLSVFLCPSK